MSAETIGLMVTAILVVTGWAVSHRSALRQNIAEKRRETRVTHLRTAYLTLCEAADHGLSNENEARFQRALNDIQLVADAGHYHLLDRFVEELEARQGADIDELLAQLRDGIRRELDLPPMPGPRLWVRLKPRATDSSPEPSSGSTAKSTPEIIDPSTVPPA